jgi:Zn-dependent metalloprotease
MARSISFSILALAGFSGCIGLVGAGCGGAHAGGSLDGGSVDPGGDPIAALIAETGHPWTVRWHADVHTPAFLEGRTAAMAATADDAARTGRVWIRSHAALFAMKDADDVSADDAGTDELGMTHARFRQEVRNRPVWGGEVVMHFSRAGELVRLNGRYIPVVDPGEPVKSADEARALAVNAVRQAHPSWAPDGLSTYAPKLYVYPLGDEPARLTWRVQVNVDDPSGAAVIESFVDARDGSLVHSADITNFVAGSGVGVFGDRRDLVVAANGASYILEDDTRGSPATRTYTAAGKSTLPGTAVRSKDPGRWDEGGNAPGAAVDAHAFVAATWDYFLNTHGRAGFDGKGKGIHATVHYGLGYANAFFDGNQLVFGDGDGAQLSPLSGALDVVAHEFTHGVTFHTAKLGYEGQTGALNEAISDIFGCFVAGDWQMGETVFHPLGRPRPLRDVAHPRATNNPETMKEYVDTAEDNGGVHINSTIVSHAAWLMLNGAHKLPAATVEKIWYRALSRYLNSRADFAAAADATLAAARDLGNESETAVREAWVTVGVLK